MLLKYGGENGGHLLEQQADLLFIVLSHGHVFGAPYPVLRFNLLDALIPNAGPENQHIPCNESVFSKARRSLRRCYIPVTLCNVDTGNKLLRGDACSS